jgi:putative hydrolase of the HAD superfamily
MISTIVFDVGDVLVDFRYEDHMRDLGFSEEAVRTLSEKMVLTEFWGEMDLGLRTEQDAREKFCRELPELRQEVIRFWENTQGLVREYPYAQPLLHSLKALGYGVYVLSNYPTETAEKHWPTFRFLPEADGYLISGFEKIAKPDPKFYRLLEERFDVNLSECLFIDDREKNIAGAEAVGMKGLLFTGYEKLLQDLEALGIKVN